MEIFEEWIFKAERDLEGAIKLFEIGHSLPDLAVYHAQQCAEKSLKAFLAYKMQPIEKSHDLNILVNLCQKFEESFKNLNSRASYLNGFDIKYRYPNDELEPTDIETKEAIAYASEILDFVKNLMTKVI
jgi:HEPN domain-containing protein